MSDKELEEATGYDYTHFDCPECGEAMEAEGDVKGETFTCDNCGCEFRIKA